MFFFLFFRNSHHDRKGGVGQCRTCEKITVDGGTHERSSSWAPPLPSFFRDTSPRSYTPSTTRLDDQLSILLSHLPQKTLDKIPRWIKTNMVSDTCWMQIFRNSVASFFRIYGYPLNISDQNILCDLQQCPTCDVNEICQNMCRVWICCFLSCVFDFLLVFVIDDVPL